MAKSRKKFGKAPLAAKKTKNSTKECALPLSLSIIEAQSANSERHLRDYLRILFFATSLSLSLSLVRTRTRKITLEYLFNNGEHIDAFVV